MNVFPSSDKNNQNSPNLQYMYIVNCILWCSILNGEFFSAGKIKINPPVRPLPQAPMRIKSYGIPEGGLLCAQIHQ